MTWWDRPSGTCRPAPVGVGRRPARWCAGAGDGMGHLHHGGSWSNPRVRARRSAPRLGGGGGPRRRFLRRTARQIMPVPRRRRRRGRAAHQWPPGPGPEVSTRGQSTRWMRASPNRSVRWARAEFGAVIYRAVSQVCKERCRRWGQERACRAHLSELARAVRSDRTGAFSPSPLTPHRVGRWEVDRMAARRTTESRGFVLEPRCLALVSRWDGRACRPGRGRMLGGLDVPRGLTGAARGEDPAVPSVTMTDCGPGWTGRVARCRRA